MVLSVEIVVDLRDFGWCNKLFYAPVIPLNARDLSLCVYLFGVDLPRIAPVNARWAALPSNRHDRWVE